MTQMVKRLTADEWFDLWKRLSDERKYVVDLVTQKGDQWKAAEGMDKDRLWGEFRSLARESEIASSRVDVVYACYVLEKYQLDKSRIFDVIDY